MLRPSGSQPMMLTRAPACSKAAGATLLAAPWAASTTTCRPSRRCGSAGAGAQVALLPVGAGGGRGRRRLRWGAPTARRGAPRWRPRSSSASLWPPRAKNLMPLSGMALCEAESMTPRSAPRSAVRNAMAGVGRMPASRTSTPAEASPAIPRRRGTPPTRAGPGRRPRGAVPLEDALLGEDVGRRDGEVERQLGGEEAVGEASHAVSAEESCHEENLSSFGRAPAGRPGPRGGRGAGAPEGNGTARDGP